MAVNTSGSFAADIEAYIADKTLPLTRKQLVVYQFGDPLTLPKGRGVTYTATRYNRVPLPYAPLAEGVPPVGEIMTIQQVTATALQWGDKVTITDVAETDHQASAVQEGDRTDRPAGRGNAGTQHLQQPAGLHAGQLRQLPRLARAAAWPATCSISTSSTAPTRSCSTLGAPRFMGDEMTDTKLEADAGGARASSNPRAHAALRLRVCIRSWPATSARTSRSSTPGRIRTSTGSTTTSSASGPASGSASRTWCRPGPAMRAIQAHRGADRQPGRPADYYIIVTASDTQNQYESQIYAVSDAISRHRPERLDHGRAADARRLHLQRLRRHHQRPGQSRALPRQARLSARCRGRRCSLPAARPSTITGLGAFQVPPGLAGHRHHRLSDLHLRTRRLRAGHARRGEVHLPEGRRQVRSDQPVAGRGLEVLLRDIDSERAVRHANREHIAFSAAFG